MIGTPSTGTRVFGSLLATDSRHPFPPPRSTSAPPISEVKAQWPPRRVQESVPDPRQTPCNRPSVQRLFRGQVLCSPMASASAGRGEPTPESQGRGGPGGVIEEPHPPRL